MFLYLKTPERSWVGLTAPTTGEEFLGQQEAEVNEGGKTMGRLENVPVKVQDTKTQYYGKARL